MALSTQFILRLESKDYIVNITYLIETNSCSKVTVSCYHIFIFILILCIYFFFIPNVQSRFRLTYWLTCINDLEMLDIYKCHSLRSIIITV